MHQHVFTLRMQKLSNAKNPFKNKTSSVLETQGSFLHHFNFWNRRKISLFSTCATFCSTNTRSFRFGYFLQSESTISVSYINIEIKTLLLKMCCNGCSFKCIKTTLIVLQVLEIIACVVYFILYIRTLAELDSRLPKHPKDVLKREENESLSMESNIISLIIISLILFFFLYKSVKLLMKRSWR